MAKTYDVSEVNKRLLFDFDTAKTDVGLLLGARSVSGTIARHAAELLEEGMFDKIILSGGLPVFQPHVAAGLVATGQCNLTDILRQKADFVTRKTEAAYMRDVLVEEQGVPADKIIFMDDQSTNTGQNIENTLDVLKKFNSVGLVTAAYHQRRALGTARKHLPFEDHVLCSHAVYPFGLTKENWDRPVIRGFVQGEMIKMDSEAANSYVSKGFCVDPDIEAEQNRLKLTP